MYQWVKLLLLAAFVQTRFILNSARQLISHSVVSLLKSLPFLSALQHSQAQVPPAEICCLLWIKITWRHWKTNMHHLGNIQTFPETKQYRCPYSTEPISFTHASTKQISEILLQLLFLWKGTISNILSLFILCNCWPAVSTASVTLELLHKLKAKGVSCKRQFWHLMYFLSFTVSTVPFLKDTPRPPISL